MWASPPVSFGDMNGNRSTAARRTMAYASVALGVDPGTAITGYGVVAEDEAGTFELLACGVIRTDAHQPMHLRLLEIFQDLQALIAEFAPDEMAVEKLFFGRNVTTAITVGQARGAILLAAALRGWLWWNTRRPKSSRRSPATATQTKGRFRRWYATCSTWRRRPSRTMQPTVWRSPSVICRQHVSPSDLRRRQRLRDRIIWNKRVARDRILCIGRCVYHRSNGVGQISWP